MQAEYVWIPGVGPDAQALQRLKEHCIRPEQPMGEAWFISPRRKMCEELLNTDVELFPASTLMFYLEEIVQGIDAFGPMEEWDRWGYFLIAHLIARISNDPTDPEQWDRPFDEQVKEPANVGHGSIVSLIALLVTTVMAFHPRTLYEHRVGGRFHNKPSTNEYGNYLEYAPRCKHCRYHNEFCCDLLATLGLALMDPSQWPGGEPLFGMLLPNYGWRANADWDPWQLSEELSALLMLCWKYLDPDKIDFWLASVLSIPSPWWRSQVALWLVRARPVISGEVNRFPDLKKGDVGWEGMRHLRSFWMPEAPLIPRENRAAIQASLRRLLTPTLTLTWIDELSSAGEARAVLETTLDYLLKFYVIDSAWLLQE